jgi:hypothetical protein
VGAFDLLKKLSFGAMSSLYHYGKGPTRYLLLHAR